MVQDNDGRGGRFGLVDTSLEGSLQILLGITDDVKTVDLASAVSDSRAYLYDIEAELIGKRPYQADLSGSPRALQQYRELEEGAHTWTRDTG
jgi:hypothetical protein